MTELLWVLVFVLIGILAGNVLFSWGYRERLLILAIMVGMVICFGLITISATQFFPGLVYLLFSSSQAAILILTTGITMAFRMLGEKK